MLHSALVEGSSVDFKRVVFPGVCPDFDNICDSYYHGVVKADVPERGTYFTHTRDHRFFLALLIVNVVLARIAMRLYGDHFVLLRDAISDLGATMTRSGLPNRRSPYVFVSQMLISAAMCFWYARKLARSGLPARDHRPWLLRMCGTGFLLMPAPHDLAVPHYIHMFGGGFIFFSLWMLTMIYLGEGRQRGMAAMFWMGMFILQATVLSYAFLFAINYEHKQTAQGIGLLGLVGTLVWVTQTLARSRAHEAEQLEERSHDAATPG